MFNNITWISFCINKTPAMLLILIESHSKLYYDSLFNGRHLECFPFFTISNSNEGMKILAKKLCLQFLGNNCSRTAGSKGSVHFKGF